MDLPSFLIGLLPALAIGFVTVMGLRRRRNRRGFPLIVNPYTFTLDPDADLRGYLPTVQPNPPTTTSQVMEPNGNAQVF